MIGQSCVSFFRLAGRKGARRLGDCGEHEALATRMFCCGFLWFTLSMDVL